MQRLLELAGGTNPFGEPMYRYVWGWNRLELIGGRWTDRDPSTGIVLRERVEMRRVPKYGTPLFEESRWYVERWYPASHFGPKRNWIIQTIEVDGAHTVESMGPYPARGDYKHFFTIHNKRNEFLQLTWPRAIWMAGVVWKTERTRKRTLAEEKEGIAKQEEKERQVRREMLDATIPVFDSTRATSFT